jgi:hypothetical protein
LSSEEESIEAEGEAGAKGREEGKKGTREDEERGAVKIGGVTVVGGVGVLVEGRGPISREGPKTPKFREGVTNEGA